MIRPSDRACPATKTAASRARIACLCALLATSTFAAELKWQSRPQGQEPNLAYIAAGGATGSEDFAAVLDRHVGRGLVVRQVYLGRAWTEDRALQEQLQAQLRRIASSELERALRAAHANGSVPAAKAAALRPLVGRAFMQTNLVARLNRSLERHGLEVSEVQIERLALAKVDGGFSVNGAVSLIVNPRKPIIAE